MEPRAFSPSPIGTNFLISSYAFSSGQVGLDPSLPISNVKAKINSEALGYSHTFSLFERMTSAAIIVPFVQAKITGDIEGEGREVRRDGPGDIKFRVATNPIGGAALTPEEFAKRVPTTALGTSLTVVAPSGDYDSSHLINIGANRWTFKPEIGISQPLGNWFTEGSCAVSLYTDNNNFFNGKTREQAPLTALQLHAGYTFSPGLWLAADGIYYTGGKTTIDGIENKDTQTNSRYGLTLSMPISNQFSFKIVGSRGLITRIGGDFTTLSAMLQYRWFD